MKSKKYQLKHLYWLVKDEAEVKFHVKNNDYFGTIATILDLIKQQIKNDTDKNDAVFQKIFSDLETDLMFLQKNYQIKPKTKNKNNKPKGKLKSQ